MDRKNISTIKKIIFVSLGALAISSVFIPVIIKNKSIAEKPKQNLKLTTKSNSSEDIEVLFTPGDKCTQRIVDHILSAKEEILVQAYSFTSHPIINALISKKRSGVKVIIVLDKSQENSIYTLKVKNAGIEIYIDKLPGIAHNKVIIIDNEKVFTGSFNFSAAAETRNAENSVLITNKKIVEKFIKNFKIRLNASYPLKENNKSISKL